MPYQKAWAVGEREGVLQRLIGLYKFDRAISGHRILGNLLLDVVPHLPEIQSLYPFPHQRAEFANEVMIICF